MYLSKLITENSVSLKMCSAFVLNVPKSEMLLTENILSSVLRSLTETYIDHYITKAVEQLSVVRNSVSRTDKGPILFWLYRDSLLT